MRTIIVGYGNQGKKRERYIENLVGVVESDPTGMLMPVSTDLTQVPLDSFDAAVVCTPTDQYKADIVAYLLTHGKHVLVEKPLWPTSSRRLRFLADTAKNNKVACYTAYNHLYDPAVGMLINMVKLIGQPYYCRMFYGNGTADNVRGSWRDKIPLGVIPEVGSHLFSIAARLFGLSNHWEAVSAHDFRNEQLDYALIVSRDYVPQIELEMTYLSWKNTFTIDVFGSEGSMHVDGLTKWGRSTFTHRQRVYPSGAPSEHSTSFVEDDRTWKQEWEFFKSHTQVSTDQTLWSDIALAQVFEQLQQQVEEKNEGGVRWYHAPWADAQASDYHQGVAGNGGLG